MKRRVSMLGLCLVVVLLLLTGCGLNKHDRVPDNVPMEPRQSEYADIGEGV